MSRRFAASGALQVRETGLSRRIWLLAGEATLRWAGSTLDQKATASCKEGGEASVRTLAV